MNTENKNVHSEKVEINGITYYDRGIITAPDGSQYHRKAVHTHFIAPDESKEALVEQYIKPILQEGDVLAFTAKVMGLCTGNYRTLEQVKPGFWAKLLSGAASHNSTGIGMHQPYKMQLTIDVCGLPRVLLASAVSAVTKPFGIKGLFYIICGHDIGGMDGFYPDSAFEEYKKMAILNPLNCDELSTEVLKATGVDTVVMDANDFDPNILGKSEGFPLTDAQIQDAMRDNPSGQNDELTPFIIIHKL